VWRPVRAEQLGDGTFRVLGPVPEDEEWEYKPGEVVTAKRRVFDSGEEGLVAERPVVGPSNQ
jgi:hypothetical protein